MIDIIQYVIPDVNKIVICYRKEEDKYDVYLGAVLIKRSASPSWCMQLKSLLVDVELNTSQLTLL